jgi:hypothetical protein
MALDQTVDCTGTAKQAITNHRKAQLPSLPVAGQAERRQQRSDQPDPARGEAIDQHAHRNRAQRLDRHHHREAQCGQRAAPSHIFGDWPDISGETERMDRAGCVAQRAGQRQHRIASPFLEAGRRCLCAVHPVEFPLPCAGPLKAARIAAACGITPPGRLALAIIGDECAADKQKTNWPAYLRKTHGPAI